MKPRAIVGGGRAATLPSHPAPPAAETINTDVRAHPDVLAPAHAIPRPDGYYASYVGERLPFFILDLRLWQEAARVTATGGEIVVDTGREAPVLIILDRMRQAGIVGAVVERSPTGAVRLRGWSP